ncbi:MAG: fibrobacter succinogenes major paralogous domain-containing protein, partial [Bacteroidota bacterium]
CDGIPAWGGCLPQLTTPSATSITSTGATTGGDVTADGGASVTARGMAYGTTSAAGPQPCPGTPTVTDVDNNTYNTVPIGTQCWTQSNLKVSKYRNGDSIPTGLSNSAWENTTSGAYAIYDNAPVNDGLYGKLYNHYAVTDSRGLCPTGWHIPSDGEWNILVKYFDPNADTVCANCTQSGAGGALKSTATQPTLGGWLSPNTGATNSSGFTALPGGLRFYYGNFYYLSANGFWWSSSVSSGSFAWTRYLYNNTSYIDRYDYNRTGGFSVRCCRD